MISRSFLDNVYFLPRYEITNDGRNIDYINKFTLDRATNNSLNKRCCPRSQANDLLANELDIMLGKRNFQILGNHPLAIGQSEYVFMGKVDFSANAKDQLEKKINAALCSL